VGDRHRLRQTARPDERASRGVHRVSATRPAIGSQVPHRDPAVVVAQVPDGTMLLHARTELYSSLDEVGSAIWELIDGDRTVAQIVDAMLAEYDAEADELGADVEALLMELAEHDLIRLTDSAQ